MLGLPLAICLVLAPALTAQETSLLLREGDLVDGSALGYSGGATIDDAGHWWTKVRVEAAGGQYLAHLLREGASWLHVGQRIAAPSARVLNPGDPVGGDSNRVLIVVLDDIQPPLTLSGPRAAVLRNERAVFIQGERLNVLGLPASALCGRLEAVAASSHDALVAHLLVAGNPTLVRVRFAPDGSELVRERILAGGDDLGAGRSVADFARVAVDERGAWLVRVTTTGGASCLVGPSGVVLSSGDPSPRAGRDIADVIRHVDGNEFDQYAAVVRLTGDPATDQLLLVDGAALAQEGALVPSLSPLVPPLPLADIGPVRRARSGATYWLASTTAGSFSEGSFLRDGVPFLQTGVSRVDGETVSFFYPAANHFEVSPNGRFWLGRVFLGNDEAYVRVDFGTSEPRAGCVPAPGSLRHLDGLVLPGRTLALELDAPAPLGALARLHLSLGGPEGPFQCGLPSPFGEFLVDPSGNLGALVAGTWLGLPLQMNVPLPPSIALVERVLFAQGSFVTPGSVTLTNGLRFEVGAP